MPQLLFRLMCAGILGLAVPSAPPLHRYVVTFSRKTPSVYSFERPEAFLSSRALARRSRFHIVVDSTDLPVNPAFLDSLGGGRRMRIRLTCRWLNAAVVETADTGKARLWRTFSFVASVREIDCRPVRAGNGVPGGPPPSGPDEPFIPDSADYGAAFPQTHQLHAEALHRASFLGDGVEIAILDAGFYGYRSNPLLRHTRIAAAWDFVGGGPLPDRSDLHGTQVLSVLAADLPGRMVGMAPRATFLLLRTESVETESILEEYAWAAAAAFADSAGADICTSSLGYSTFPYPGESHTYADLDGRTTPVARAARMAASKGMLVVLSAGNAGSGSWKYITTPADAAGALCVGAVDRAGRIARFSGQGPTADGRPKPDLVALGVGTVVSDFGGRPVRRSGTSYSCPLVAGLAACLWEAYPRLDAAEILECLRRSADRYTHPDNKYGYGIPDGARALAMLKERGE